MAVCLNPVQHQKQYTAQECVPSSAARKVMAKCFVYEISIAWNTGAKKPFGNHYQELLCPCHPDRIRPSERPGTTAGRGHKKFLFPYLRRNNVGCWICWKQIFPHLKPSLCQKTLRDCLHRGKKSPGRIQKIKIFGILRKRRVKNILSFFTRFFYEADFFRSIF